MNRFKVFSLTMLAGLLSWAVCTSGATAGIREKMLLTTIRLPPGFEIGLYCDEVPGARSMALSPSGILFVGTRQTGKVYAVLDKDKDGRADQVLTIAQGLDMPNGVAFMNGDLYIAAVNRILRFRQIEAHLGKPLRPEVVTDQFPDDPHHGARFIRFGPDGKLYVAVGAPCNVCQSDNPIFATITRINPDGSGLEIFAHGVRDSLGFDWRPGTGVLWFTDNGRDWLGDNQPPDELNRADVKGLHFGFPYCYGTTTADPKFGGTQSCGQFTPPAAELGPHVAALGMRFYTGHMFPEPYQGQIFIAEHGSWNRTEKIGYRVTLVTLKGNQVASYTPFAQGWLDGNSAWGRPVDVQPLADGSLLVSDDLNGAIYRITYKPQ
jgi:glucose/arabinose dehydrogenase